MNTDTNKTIVAIGGTPDKGDRVAQTTEDGLRMGTCTASGAKTFSVRWDDETSNRYKLDDPDAPRALHTIEARADMAEAMAKYIADEDIGAKVHAAGEEAAAPTVRPPVRTAYTEHNLPHPSGLNRKQRRDTFRRERAVTKALSRRVFEGRRTAALGEYHERAAALRKENPGITAPETHLRILMDAQRKVADLEPITKVLKRMRERMAARAAQYQQGVPRG